MCQCTTFLNYERTFSKLFFLQLRGSRQTIREAGAEEELRGEVEGEGGEGLVSPSRRRLFSSEDQ